MNEFTSNLGIYGILLLAMSPLWLLSVRNHRTPWHDGKVNLGLRIGRCFGSRDGWLDRTSFSLQVTLLGLILWDVVLLFLGVSNLAISGFLAMVTGITVRLILRLVKSSK